MTERGSTTGLRRFAAGPAAASPPPAAAPAAAEAETGPRPDPGQAEGQPAAEEHCEFCATPIPGEHGHVADLEGSALMCACRACYLLFTHSGAGLGGQAEGGRRRYQSVPDRYRSDPAHPLSPAEWDSLQIPVGLAFFLRTTRGAGITAFYPSPAGATECELNLEAWTRIAAEHPLLDAADPDVEAILISRGSPQAAGQEGAEGGQGPVVTAGQRGAGGVPEPANGASQPDVEAFLVPIDACYELAGRMRLQWRGFDGGAEARRSIADFLDRVRQRSRDLAGEARHG